MSFCAYKRRTFNFHFTHSSASSERKKKNLTEAAVKMNSRISILALLYVFIVVLPCSVFAQWNCPFDYRCGKRQVCKPKCQIYLKFFSYVSKWMLRYNCWYTNKIWKHKVTAPSLLQSEKHCFFSLLFSTSWVAYIFQWLFIIKFGFYRSAVQMYVISYSLP